MDISANYSLLAWLPGNAASHIYLVSQDALIITNNR